ncbi:hypothetical protein CRI94_06495 [Longibacter salinarum]|uniref:Sucrase ferredoxin n=1 Tax=Longibacter salinarum TaxID=1850348 RepID=A0A2A8CYL0_9BACT|nr:sucrase ferredoxin [Longibacter salinarum]PEN13720.1 hypothetical protein CRI94_06495 [Longibacter salinarum]
MPDAFCSDIARRGDVDLNGSATVASYWLCIEHPEPWEEREISSGSLPPRLVECIGQWEEALPGLRTQAIRREVNQFDEAGGVTVFIASVQPGEQSLRRLRLSSLEALADLDVPAIILGHVDEPPGRRLDAPIVLTCTNGKRDACCALKGRIFQSALEAVAPQAAWQATHLGGHRFAPTALVLPHGHQYGWLEADDADEFWSSASGGRIFQFDRYRGCTAHRRPIQAAVIAVRREVGADAVEDIEDIRFEHRPGDVWHLRVTCRGQKFTVRVRRWKDGLLPKSCGGDPKPVIRQSVSVEAASTEDCDR